MLLDGGLVSSYQIEMILGLKEKRFRGVGGFQRKKDEGGGGVRVEGNETPHHIMRL